MEMKRIKEILDRECYENWHAKRCQRYSDNLVHIHTPCWICDKNEALVREIAEVKEDAKRDKRNCVRQSS